jgi:hypothetical protein
MNRCAGWLFVLCALFVTFDVLARKSRLLLAVDHRLSGYMLGVGIAWGRRALDARPRAHRHPDPKGAAALARLPALARARFARGVRGFLAYGAWHTTVESWDFRATDNSLLKTPLVIPQGLWLFGIGVFGVMAALRLVEVALLLPQGDIQEIEHLTGPRSYLEEADEALEAIGSSQHLKK